MTRPDDGRTARHPGDHEEPDEMLTTECAYPAIDDQQDFWEIWNATARDPTHLNPWCMRRAETMLGFLEELHLHEPSILDFGCGTGWFSEMLAEYGTVTGVDLAEGVIADARARCPRVTFMAGDIFQMPLPAAHFDVVVSQEVIAHVEDQAGYLDRAAHVLRPNGHLIITTPNRFVVDRGDFFPPQPPEHLERWLTIGRLKALLRHRFTLERLTTIIPMGHRGVLRLVNSPRLSEWVATVSAPGRLDVLKERLGLGYIVVALARKRA